MADDRSLIYEFVSEAKEHLADVADDLLGLEQGKADAQRYRVDRLFRAMHSIKGGAAFFGCRVIEALAHVMETVLDELRRNPGPVDAALTDTLLAGADRLQALLDDVEHSNEADLSELLERLRRFLNSGQWTVDSGQGKTEDQPAPSSLSTVHCPLSTMEWDLAVVDLTERPPDHTFLYGVCVDLAACRRLLGLNPLAVLREVQQTGAVLDARVDVAGDDLGAPPPEQLWYQAVLSSALPADKVSDVLAPLGVRVAPLTPPIAPAPVPVPLPVPVPEEPSEEPAAAAPPSFPVSRPQETLRIPVALVDRLMTLAGELVLVRNQAIRLPAALDPEVRPVVQRLAAVTSELQDAVMRTRMQPVGNLFGKFPRLVRDLARQLGKDIDLEVGGTEVELDKNILESLSDPLTHLVRNCCDHGIEPPDVRLRAGKAHRGRVRLSAKHVSGQIFIEVRDDGRGIDPDRVRQKAFNQGLRSPVELDRMTDRELFGLILLPGFSTAESVTDLSGRGVGMDVVQTNVDRLGGALDIDSTPGEGTAFTLRLPLTLAIIPCLLVVSGGERYAIPQKDVEELVSLNAALTRARVERAHDQEVVRLRDRLLPLVRLDEVLARPRPFNAATRAEVLAKHRADGPELSFAVLRVGGQRFGLAVDEVLGSEEVVVKPMHALMKPLACFAGATILGDGRVALILNVEGVARHADVRFEPGDAGRGLPAETEDETQAVLLFRYGPLEQFAIPLAMVRRIVTVRGEQIERVGDQEFVTVDGTATFVLRLDRYLSVSRPEPRDEMLLLLPKYVRRKPLGILLTAVVEAGTLSVNLDADLLRADGLVGSAVVNGRLTLFVDVYRLADLVEPDEARRAPSPPAGPKRRVLLVEDTKFFRQLVKGYLEGEGYEVTLAENGAEGLKKLDETTVDLVVSDIEMPVLDGWGFARALRQRPDGASLPLLALTTLNSERDRERALECGFDCYEVKVDRERFLAAVAALLRDRGR